MNKEHTEKLFNDFPEIFKDRNKPVTESLMAFGFECPDRWFDIIYDGCKKMRAYVDHTGVDCTAVQVKEKYGGLRFYLQTYEDVLDKIISEMETQVDTLEHEYRNKST